MQNVDSAPESGSLFSEQLRDIEYNGALNRATQQGANFALLLAMLEQDCTLRPYIEPDNEPSLNLAQELASLAHYPTIPLKPGEQYWTEVMFTQQLIAAGALEDAKLWLAMHPEPLSLHNSAEHIPDEIVENCSLQVRERINKQQSNRFAQDATGLYDILDNLSYV